MDHVSISELLSVNAALDLEFKPQLLTALISEDAVAEQPAMAN